VVADVDLIVGLEKAAAAEDHLGFAVSVKPGARNHIENAVGAVSDFGVVAAALRLKIVNILGIDLRSEIAADVGVGNLHSIDLPAHLVAPTHVEHVVRHISSRNKVSDHLQAVGPVGSRRSSNLDPIYRCRRRDGIDVGGRGFARHRHRLVHFG